MGQFLKVEIESKVATVTINNPPVNALSQDVLKELETTMDELQGNKDVKVIILTGVGPVFIAGADIKQFSQIQGEEDGKKAAGFGQSSPPLTVFVWAAVWNWRWPATFVCVRTGPAWANRKLTSASSRASAALSA